MKRDSGHGAFCGLLAFHAFFGRSGWSRVEPVSVPRLLQLSKNWVRLLILEGKIRDRAYIYIGWSLYQNVIYIYTDKISFDHFQVSKEEFHNSVFT